MNLKPLNIHSPPSQLFLLFWLELISGLCWYVRTALDWHRPHPPLHLVGLDNKQKILLFFSYTISSIVLEDSVTKLFMISIVLLVFSVCLYTVKSRDNNNGVNNKVVNCFRAVTCWSAQRAVVEEAIRGVVTAAAHRCSAVSVEVGLTLFLKVGSRGLEEDRKGTWLVKVGLNCKNYKTETAITLKPFLGHSFSSTLFLSLHLD